LLEIDFENHKQPSFVLHSTSMGMYEGLDETVSGTISEFPKKM